jgi:hypothetical protein
MNRAARALANGLPACARARQILIDLPIRSGSIRTIDCLGEGSSVPEVINVGQNIVPGYVIRLRNEPRGPLIEGRTETAESEDQ